MGRLIPPPLSPSSSGVCCSCPVSGRSWRIGRHPPKAKIRAASARSNKAAIKILFFIHSLPFGYGYSIHYNFLFFNSLWQKSRFCEREGRFFPLRKGKRQRGACGKKFLLVFLRARQYYIYGKKTDGRKKGREGEEKKVFFKKRKRLSFSAKPAKKSQISAEKI